MLAAVLIRESRGRPRTALRRWSRGLTVVAGLSTPAAAVTAQARSLDTTASAEPTTAAAATDGTSPSEAEPTAATVSPPADEPEPEPEAEEAPETKVDEAEAEEPEVDDAEVEVEEADEAAGDDDSPEAEAAPKPPRIDGPYLGAVMFGGLGLLRLNNLDTDGPFVAMGGTVSVGQMVFPWLGLGLHGGGGGGVRSQDGARQRLGQGHIGMEFRFVPLPQRLPLSLAASFGFGGGAVRQAGVDGRSGFGGAQFGVSARYEWFPGAHRYRATRGGGLGLGPQVGWTGFTPAAKGRPMSNVFYVGLATTFYFGS